MKGVVKFLIRWLTAWIVGATVGGSLLGIAVSLDWLYAGGIKGAVNIFILVIAVPAGFATAWLVVNRVNRWLKKWE